MTENKILDRKDVPETDKWNLSSLYKSNDDWENDLKALEPLVQKVASFNGKLGESSETLLEALKSLEQAELKLETIYNYASLQHNADEDDSAAADREGRASMAYTDFSAKLSFFDPELQAIPDEKINEWIELPEFADYKIYLKKLLLLKPYMLSEKEDKVHKLRIKHLVY